MKKSGLHIFCDEETLLLNAALRNAMEPFQPLFQHMFSSRLSWNHFNTLVL